MNEPLPGIAARIADGDELDWQSLAETTDEPETLANLKIVALLGRRLRQLDELTVPEAWGGLDVLKKIASGAFADVYLARDAALDRDVALKIFRLSDDGHAGRMLSEGRLLARIDHPNVVRVYGAASHDGVTGLWMERVDGESLQAWVEEGRLLSDREAAVIGVEIAKALSAVHAAGVVHGDIKAANVLRDSRGRVRVADFGSGLDLGSSASAQRISGTPLYLAPEVIAGESPTERSDVYSLGVLLFLLMTGRYPAEADSIDELHALAADQRLRLSDLRPDLDDELRRIVTQCLADDPNDRPASAGVLADALSRYLADGNERRLPFGRRSLLLAGIAAALLLVGNFVLGPTAYRFDTRFTVTSDGVARVIEGAGRVRLGDTLQLAVQADSAMHVYVFAEDDTGHSWGLFPLDDIGASNPIPAGRSVLPGDEWSWQVSQPAASEVVHVVASPTPLPEVDRAYRRLQPAVPLEGMAPRGIGGLVRAPEGRAADGSAASQVVAIIDSGIDVDSAAGTSYRRIVLDHRP